jgi:hypothetical protein
MSNPKAPLALCIFQWFFDSTFAQGDSGMEGECLNRTISPVNLSLTISVLTPLTLGSPWRPRLLPFGACLAPADPAFAGSKKFGGEEVAGVVPLPATDSRRCRSLGAGAGRWRGADARQRKWHLGAIGDS